MRILVFSDMHWVRARIPYLLETCGWISSHITPELDAVVFCGDLNHTHGYIDVETLESMSRGLSEILHASERAGVKFYLISGNHDIGSRDGTENVLSMISSFSNATCFTTSPSATKLSEEENIFGLFCPWVPTSERGRKSYFEALDNKEIPQTKDARVIQFSHWEIDGVPYKPGDKVRSSSHVLPTNRTNAQLIVNGHYHHPAIHDKIPPVVFVGSPCYHNYSDSMVDTPRGFTILDSQPTTASMLVVNDWDVRRFGNPFGPIYHTIDATDSLAISEVENMSEEDRSRLRLRIRVSEDMNYDAVRPSIIMLGELVEKMKVVGKAAIRDTITEDIPVPSFDSDDVLDNYLSVKDTDLDKTRLADAGRRLIEEALSVSSKH